MSLSIGLYYSLPLGIIISSLIILRVLFRDHHLSHHPALIILRVLFLVAVATS